MLASLYQDQRFGQAALIAEPEIGPVGKLFDRMLGKELTAYSFRRTFVGECLGTVLAKFVDRPRVRIRPRARLAIDTALLIELQQAASAANNPHLAKNVPERVRNGVNAGGSGRRRCDF